MSEKKSLNEEQLRKVSGGEGQDGKWYFCYYNKTSQECGEWFGPYDSENDIAKFVAEHPIQNPDEYEIQKQFMPISGRTIPTYL